jgi:predicted DNA-binding protein (UPF0251 family)
MNKFYVYAYLREDRYTPYYIGKGCGKRCYYKKGKNCNPPEDRNRIIIIKDNLLEEDAFNLEKVLINFWGRKGEGGILLNISPGGSAPPIGDGSNLLPYNKKRKITGSKIHPARKVVINEVEYISLTQASEILNIKRSTLSKRVRLGKNIDVPIKKYNKITVLIDEEEYNIKEASKIMNISESALRKRISRNHPSVKYILI